MQGRKCEEKIEDEKERGKNKSPKGEKKKSARCVPEGPQVRDWNRRRNWEKVLQR